MGELLCSLLSFTQFCEEEQKAKSFFFFNCLTCSWIEVLLGPQHADY